MEVTDFEEFKKLSEGKSQSTIYHYKSTLQKFCEFHNMNPRELINEAKNWQPEDSETSHLEENPANKKLTEWHKHLTEEREVSENSAQTYWRYVRGFYQKFGDFVTKKTPGAKGHNNEKPDFTASDIKTMVDGCRSLRDRAIILVGFQGGMDPAEICRLDYGQVKHGVENGNNTILVWKTRKKTGVTHHSPLLEDSVEALKMYINEREKEQGELEDDDPLFVTKDTKERITEGTIRQMMRDLRERIGDQIPEVQRVDGNSNYNPMSPKYLRRAFGKACDEAEIHEKFKHYWLGHEEPYDGAYSAGQIDRDIQLTKPENLKPRLSISTPKELEEDIREQKKDIQDLRTELVEQQKKIKNLESQIEKVNILGEFLEEKGALEGLKEKIEKIVEEKEQA